MKVINENMKAMYSLKYLGCFSEDGGPYSIVKFRVSLDIKKNFERRMLVTMTYGAET